MYLVKFTYTSGAFALEDPLRAHMPLCTEPAVRQERVEVACREFAAIREGTVENFQSEEEYREWAASGCFHGRDPDWTPNVVCVTIADYQALEGMKPSNSDWLLVLETDKHYRILAKYDAEAPPRTATEIELAMWQAGYSNFSYGDMDCLQEES